ncbi:molybdate ABC transporter substrate-binding protein [Loigolactobacillus zhaoyuanensis]|uniref:Molybdate ABC transporter substrate-binding protein n=1 Tax=Loigolactobacillus zhaoyuanensis TaxID=2486017 RepID=A0ABW8UH21_9LACO|nr:molybdate ABC transporter substrate-binding protein [Loigolactobacillus zhaoyuanensis]
MIKKLLLFVSGFLIVSFGLLTSHTAPAQAVTIHYSAAASLKDSLTEIAQQYQTKQPKVKIDLDFAGSGQIKQKVLSGAPIDGVLTASKTDMQALTQADKAINSKVLLKNDLVVIQNKQARALKGTLKQQLQAANKIALGEPKLVPAGRYATESLASLKLQLTDKFVYANDVRQVLAFVASGNAEIGFVYRTDARISDQVRISAKVPAKTHSPIRYYVGVSATDAAKKRATKKFNRYLASRSAQKVFKQAGFKMAN